MSGKRTSPQTCPRSHRDVYFDGHCDLELARLEELDAVALEEVTSWRIDQALRAANLPRE